MAELSWYIESITELDYDGVSETVKQYCPKLDGDKLHLHYIRDDAEAEATAKTSIKTDLTDKGYVWASEV